eukprot:TRINITY_DN48682_c0_g1_i1.p1 TRINITY_DN48682_c0_g1~~TRINITY_DN48682_c0_g1_i1.p1  ORF type:complete len:205 (-),score=39.51 TRINITY_DN48682_c0_g1_i1:92-706(-)
MDVERKEWALFAQEAYDTQPPVKPRAAKNDPLIVRKKRKYEQEGMRRTARAVLLVHVRGHPHVLALQRGLGGYDLPGGTLAPGEPEKDGLNRKLKRFIFNDNPNVDCEWKVGELLAVWWCPSFDDQAYPYLPQHVARPKECIKVYQVTLPERCVFEVPAQDQLVAVPFFDLQDEPQKYGPLLAGVPQMASRFATVAYEMVDGGK